MRHSLPALCLLAGLSVGCSASLDPKGGGSDDGGGNSDGPGDDGGDDSNVDSGDDGGGAINGSGTVSDLTDLKASLQRNAEGCQTVDDISHPGAATYFYGELQPVQGAEVSTWEGREEWLLYANEAWQEVGVNDCAVTWSVQAEEVGPGACAACDVTVAVAATVDIARTSCPEELWEEDSNYTVTYDVMWDDTGVSNWFFSESGNPMGTGSHSDGAMNFVTSRSCVWF